MKKLLSVAAGVFPFLFCSLGLFSQNQVIPLPEHPRPDFERPQWINLNGTWDFRFDKENVGEKNFWYRQFQPEQKILVPFSWGSPLSGVANEADIGWYSRTIDIPESWKGQRIFIVFGASDWRTTAWLDGTKLGFHQGGYTPFEFEITPLAVPGKTHRLVVKVDDSPAQYKLEGKQGYGPARGFWQTVYLEARGSNYLKKVHFVPDIDRSLVQVTYYLGQPLDQPAELMISVSLPTGKDTVIIRKLKKGEEVGTQTIFLPGARLWTLDDPWLYDAELKLVAERKTIDEVKTYFGMRKISVVNLPGTAFPYIALNNRPVYLQLTLDQCYHPEGFYTYPSDAFMRDEILRSKKIGLNGNRLHIKVEIPRKLYWADKLGLLIMADVPNSWGEPGPEMRKEWQYAMEQMIDRDFNHPSIFSWVLFNETWGLFSSDGKKRVYADSTAHWVEQLYYRAKKLDPIRLVEDNSACNYDHVVSDINSWHSYLPGYAWKDFMKVVIDSTFPGSPWNYRHPAVQAQAPMINSECGNVWGYNGSTGDVDWSWDYHRMINEFRMHPKMGGWLYTEHHDVINEWNGYYRYDRSEKETGLGELVPGMSLNDLHSPFYLSAGSELCRQVFPDEEVVLPLFASFMTDACAGDSLVIVHEMYAWDQLGNYNYVASGRDMVPYKPWYQGHLADLNVRMPCYQGLALVSWQIETRSGKVLHRNFTTFYVTAGNTPGRETITRQGKTFELVRFHPASYASAGWTTKTSRVMNGLKVWGDGKGYFEYRIQWPSSLKKENIAGLTFLLEASAKELLGKDRPEGMQKGGDYMRGEGFHDPGLNPNAYPMTDTRKFPSLLTVRVNGISAGQFYLPDDPADHRGILSWFSQPQNGRLDEAGSYGYLVQAVVPLDALQEGKDIIIRLEVNDGLPGGLAIYGERSGRYPFDPTLVFQLVH